jgi:hypothetical protein
MQYNGHGLIIYVSFMVKCVCDIWALDPMVVRGRHSHYRIGIIRGVGHPRLDSVVPLVLCTVACNIRGTSIILQVPQDNANPAEKG